VVLENSVSFIIILYIFVRDVCVTFKAEMRPRKHISEIKMGPTHLVFCLRQDQDETFWVPRQDKDQDIAAPETDWDIWWKSLTSSRNMDQCRKWYRSRCWALCGWRDQGMMLVCLETSRLRCQDQDDISDFYMPELPCILHVNCCRSMHCVLCRWYFGKIKRIEAEKKLLQADNEHGSFLIRDSESRHHDFSLSSE